MKKLFIFAVTCLILLSMCSCAQSGNENKVDPNVNDNAYVIEDMLFERNIDELKKQFPDYTAETIGDSEYLHINEKWGNIDGIYTYKITNAEVEECTFAFAIEHYNDTSMLATAEKLPNPENTNILKSTIDDIYKLSLEKYKIDNYRALTETYTSGTTKKDDINSLDSFSNIFALLNNGLNSEYRSCKTYFVSSDYLYNIEIINAPFYWNIKLILQH